MPAPDDFTERLIGLETAVTHLQHDFEQLHHVALELQQEVRAMSLRLQRLEHRLTQVEEPPETRSPDEERPPHW
jgi:uncharacterized coiled-coil protein SlyX